MIKSTFLNVLKKYEQKYNIKLSRREFSRITGIKYSITVRLFNNQIHGLKFDTLNKLVRFFHLPPSKFLIYSNQAMILSLTDGKESTDQLCYYDDNNVLDDISGICGITISYLGHPKSIKLLLMPYKPTVIDDSCPVPNGYKDLINTSSFDFYYQLSLYGNALDTTEMLSPQSKHFKYVLNNLSSRLQNYIYSRMLLHSGFVKLHSKINSFYVNGATAKPAESTQVANNSLNFSNKIFNTSAKSLLHIWKRQPTEYDKHGNKYRLISSNQGQPISIHDYTTNNFKD